MRANKPKIISGQNYWFCKPCKRWKPDSEFHRQKRRRNGLSWACKKCHNLHAAKTRDKYKALLVTRRYRERNLERVREFDRKNKRKNNKKYPINPLKRSARQKAWYSVSTGKLTRPKVCSGCGNRESSKFKLNAHHRDYKKPLEIEWLCTKCHGILHRKYS